MNEYSKMINSSEVVLIEFYASWCPHCQRMMPIVGQVKDLVGEDVKIYQLDIDKHADLADIQKVESIPTFILYDGGREVWRNTGEMTGEALLGKIEQYEKA